MGTVQSANAQAPIVFTLFYVPYDPTCLNRLREWIMLGHSYKQARFRAINTVDQQNTHMPINVKYPYITVRNVSSMEECVYGGCAENKSIKNYIDKL